MNARTFLVDGVQLTRLRRGDLPAVAKAIVGFERKQVRVERHLHREVAYYRFVAPGFVVKVLATDWERIVPYLRDGTFNSVEVAVPGVGYKGSAVISDLNSMDLSDPFYLKVLGVLNSVFTETYPTSHL